MDDGGEPSSTVTAQTVTRRTTIWTSAASERQRHGRGMTVSRRRCRWRGQQLELHGGADFEAERRRDGDAAHGQCGRDVQSVAADVHDGQLVDGADGDGADGAGRGRVERHGDAGARGQRGGLRDGDGGLGGGHGDGRRDGLDGGGADGRPDEALGGRGGDRDHDHGERTRRRATWRRCSA